MSVRFHQFERTVHNSYEWLDFVAARIDGERRDAYQALNAVLGALRDRLPADVAVNLSAQMPLLVRGVFFDGHEPARPPIGTGDAGDFVTAVHAALAPASRIDPHAAIAAVLDVLALNVDPGMSGAIEEVLVPRSGHAVGPGVRAARAHAPRTDTAQTDTAQTAAAW
jgi:uncharacterized protein (DUF2267 family)